MNVQTSTQVPSNTARLLATLEQLLAIEIVDLSAALDRACQLVAEALSADKVDAMFHDPTTDTLVAAGTSPTPMGQKQRAIGMHRLQRANGGRGVGGCIFLVVPTPGRRHSLTRYSVKQSLTCVA